MSARVMLSVLLISWALELAAPVNPRAHETRREEASRAGVAYPLAGEPRISSAMVAHDPHIGPETDTMALQLAFTPGRKATRKDRSRAALLVATLRKALARYRDYHAAEREGFRPFHPELGQPVVHFTRLWYGLKAVFTFNPAEPTSLLYRRVAGSARLNGGYKLIGAMYTAGGGASLEKLNRRVPLSVAR